VPDDVEHAIAALGRGGIVVYPTETFYGLGARALDARGVAAVAALKGRDAGKPIAVIVGDVSQVECIVARVPALARRLIARWWPGPLTLVLPARGDLPPELTAGTGTIGVRVSSHPVARALAAGGPLTATSANPGGMPSARDIATARAYFGEHVEVYVDRGTLAGEVGSTVLVVGDDSARVVRAGAVAVEALRDVLGETPISLDETDTSRGKTR